tara:strand:+ start:246 stop:440 length:195 start_codon:yes stop_codon:yes gene_type:complete
MSEDIWALLFVGALSLILGLVGEADYQDALDQEALYCQQTLLFKRSGGQSGWPDYKGIREKVCE